MVILGISAFYHDSAAALLVDGRIVAAAQEERFTRRKHDARFPAAAIAYCLDAGGVRLDEVDHVVFFEKPFLKFERLLETYVDFAPRGFRSFRRAMPLWIKEKLFQKAELARLLAGLGRGAAPKHELLFSEHHLSHAASAFYPSPFAEAAVLTMDGVGEWATTTVAIGQGTELKIVREIPFPNSLGLLYSAFTYYTGFKVNSGEYKVMGLAPYGEPRYVDRIREHLIDLKADGSFRLDQRYFDYCTGLTMTNRRFDRLFGGPPRKPEAPLEQRHMDLAASVQAVVEEAVLRLGRSIRERTGRRHLCLAGGVALNCVANGKLAREGLFDAIWIQPAAGDAGGSLGAALYAHHAYLGQPRELPSDGHEADAMAGAYLGPAFEQHDIEARLTAAGARFEVLDEATLVDRVAEDLAGEAAVGWFQGRMEFGPRALGNRSILGDPRSPRTQRDLNLKIKFRESFRPFAPAVLEEKVGAWFERDGPSPYMLLVDPVRPERRLDGRAGAGGAPGPESRRGPEAFERAEQEVAAPAARAVTGAAPSVAASSSPAANGSTKKAATARGPGTRRRPDGSNERALLARLAEVRSEIPAVTHVDDSARIQTVSRATNPRFHALISAFEARTGCPLVVNTSFNIRGEPIVCTPEDAFRCFMGTGLDVLAVGNCYLRKADQDASLAQDYRRDFTLD